jgi:hypothetical protein
LRGGWAAVFFATRPTPPPTVATVEATIEPEPGWVAYYDAHYRALYRPAYAALCPLHRAATGLSGSTRD